MGLIFFASGLGKLLEPYQNFLYIVQSYEFLPDVLELAVARAMPWFELFVGLFLILGLWIKWALRGFLLCVTGFIAIVSRALIIQLPITDCGCFGELAHFPLHVVLTFDCSLWIFAVWSLLRQEKTSSLSLDKIFN